jgi:hypothetical protein
MILGNHVGTLQDVTQFQAFKEKRLRNILLFV